MALVGGRVDIVKNLAKQIGKIKGRNQKGITTAGLFIKGRAQKDCPVEFGNLKSSAYVVSPTGPSPSQEIPSGIGPSGVQVAEEHPGKVSEGKSRIKSLNQPSCEIGFSAFYAIHVHEDLEAGHIVGKAKFLEDALINNKQKVLSIIRKEAVIRK